MVRISAVILATIVATTRCAAFQCGNMVKVPSLLSHGKLSYRNTKKIESTNHVRNSMNEVMDGIASSWMTLANTAEEDGVNAFSSTYSNASYYTVLGLYLLSFPGLWSTVKRSTKAKVKRKTYESDGEEAGGRSMKQQAAEIMAYMKANNYEVLEAAEVITFRGIVARSASQAFFLVFCTAIGMASLSLVLQIQFQNFTLPLIGKPNWFLLTLLSPYAGIYYWKSGDRVDDIKVKLVSSDDNTKNEIMIEGNEDEIDRMWRALDLTEKGMIKVEAII